jgi:transposase
MRLDFDAEESCELSKGLRDPTQTHRLLTLYVIDVDSSLSEAAAIGAVGLQTVRDWVLDVNAEASDGLIDGKASGARCA